MPKLIVNEQVSGAETKNDLLAALEPARKAFISKDRSVLSTEPVINVPVNEISEEKREIIEDEEIKTSENEELTQETTQQRHDNSETNDDYDAEIIKEARRTGWVPKEEWRHDKSKWRDAKSWVDRAELYNTIKDLRQKQRDLVQLVELNAKATTDEKLNKLKDEKRDAIRSGDVEKFDAIETQYNELVEQRKKVTEVVNKNDDIPPETMDFIQRNSDWFNDKTAKNKLLQEYAVKLDNELSSKYPTMSLSDRLRQVEDNVKTEFKLNDDNDVRVKNNSYGGASKSLHANSKKNIPTFDELKPHEKSIIDHFVRSSEIRHRKNPDKSKILTREYYIKDLYRSGVIGK